MKTRFNSYDIVCSIAEMQKLIGMRVNNVYDVDNKTYLIRLQRTEEKSVLLLESGNRIHITNFEWPKNMAPSGFSMKMRKHLKNKRLESLSQIGSDRIIDLQFGSGDAAYHIILELYDRGNIVLTDFEMTILYVLRPHTEGDKVKFAVREKYPENRARENEITNLEDLSSLLSECKVGDSLKKFLMPRLDYGPSLIEHVLLKHGFTNATKIGKTFNIERDASKLFMALEDAKAMMENAKTQSSKGFITQKREERPNTNPDMEKEYFYSNQEFHPFLFSQHEALPYQEYDSFNVAVDEFYSNAESQKIELKALQQEREAMKKLDNIKKDHDQRLTALEKAQELDKQKAELITRNKDLVENAILAIQSAIVNQMPWTDIEVLVKDATAQGDPVAKHIKQLKLETNHISLYLSDPYVANESENSDDEQQELLPPQTIDIDLAQSAYANATRYYDHKRNAAKKQQKTLESKGKALKSAEKKTKQTLKEVQMITNINKVRKVYWFEKFYWFISSENYLVIAGRDQQQNELIVKRYMRPTDLYVHADIHGASSVIIKNPSGLPVPPKTLNEAGTMAICYSVAWDAKVVTNAYWVLGEQVSKTAPTGEYLTTGSFMVRGKKNFLPPSHLVLGLSFLFRLEDSCVENHRNERRVITGGEDSLSVTGSELSRDEEEIEITNETDDENEEQNQNKLAEIKEESEDNEIKETNDVDDTDSESDGGNFPDTQIKIQHTEGTQINIITDSKKIHHVEESEKVVFLGDNNPVTINTNQRARTKSENSIKQAKPQVLAQKDENVKEQQRLKRGQKSKLKKIKEKYKDQDEEEKKIRMEFIQSAGSGKDSKKSKKEKDIHGGKNKKGAPKIPKVPIQKPESQIDDEDEPAVQADVDVIDALTGQPLAEDELLFAVPVIAPYNTLSNYKFKVKLTPGTGKKGKAAKMAVSIFSRDRATTQREKDLLKAVKDDQLARNFPGKVKLSAPKLQTFKK